MKFRFILWTFVLFILVSCGSKSQSDTSSAKQGLPSDTVWMFTKGVHKTDVRNILLSKDMRVKDDAASNSVVGISNGAIRWVGADWDIAVCRFNADNKLQSVNIMRSGAFDNGDVSGDSLMSICVDMQRIFGLAKCVSSGEWVFMNTNHVNASIKQDRSVTATIIWE